MTHTKWLIRKLLEDCQQGNKICEVQKNLLIDQSMKLNEGEIAYTSGISDIYPANIPVAKVISVNKNTNTPFQDVNVEILTDLNNFNYVFIVQ